MNRDRYHAAFDGIRFREDFQDETVQKLLDAAGQPQEKERIVMKTMHLKRTALIAAVLAVAVLAMAAAVNLLHPDQVADYMGHPELAEAFRSEDAILLDETKEFGDFNFTLMGMVSGAGISDIYEDADESHSYIVATMTRIDGEPIDPMTDNLQDILVTPLVSGYQPWELNIFTHHGGYHSVIVDGMRTAYYIFDCNDLEIFADHTIYLAVYEGFAPGNEIFQMAEDGSISYVDSFTAPHALFTLPLDPAKADPAAAAAVLDSIRNPAPDPDTIEDLDDVDPENTESFTITQEDIDKALANQDKTIDLTPAQ